MTEAIQCHDLGGGGDREGAGFGIRELYNNMSWEGIYACMGVDQIIKKKKKILP